MADREKVVRGLQCCIDSTRSNCPHDCPYLNECINGQFYEPLYRDALELLKEQPDIVRCGDCKYYREGFCYNPNTFDAEKTCGNATPDWYCADGKRR